LYLHSNIVCCHENALNRCLGPSLLPKESIIKGEAAAVAQSMTLEEGAEPRGSKSLTASQKTKSF